mmetsp:Transcript_35205/g.80342  ORF Transcript_35205/g.80342 Transcript_35205/m.80342 type:complete len:108 (+) Transcript_35205:55-378(+)
MLRRSSTAARCVPLAARAMSSGNRNSKTSMDDPARWWWWRGDAEKVAQGLTIPTPTKTRSPTLSQTRPSAPPSMGSSSIQDPKRWWWWRDEAEEIARGEDPGDKNKK